MANIFLSNAKKHLWAYKILSHVCLVGKVISQEAGRSHPREFGRCSKHLGGKRCLMLGITEEKTSDVEPTIPDMNHAFHKEVQVLFTALDTTGTQVGTELEVRPKPFLDISPRQFPTQGHWPRHPRFNPAFWSCSRRETPHTPLDATLDLGLLDPEGHDLDQRYGSQPGSLAVSGTNSASGGDRGRFYQR